MSFCIPKNLLSKLKESALKGEVNIAELYKMSSSERREFFAKYTDKELGKFINTKFEDAMISKQKDALTKWAQSVFTPEAKSKPVFKTVLDKINSLDELGVLNPKSEDSFLEDLVSDKLGVSITPDEVKAISVKAKKIQEAQMRLGDNIGDPKFEKEMTDFFVAKKDMDNYLLGLNPANKLKVFTGTIGRGMMLASVKSPILNIGSNTEIGITEALSRRLANASLKTADNKLALDYVKMTNRLYQKTGYDISRMVNLADTGVSGGRVLGLDTVHAAGPGAIRKTGQVVEDVVFKQLMGAPDVAFSSVHFADSVNLNALKSAKGNKVKAQELMRDSMRIVPQTPEGEILRAQGILDAQYATYTNKTWASKVSEGIRKVLNDVSGDVRVGDFVMPFVKTPANVIAAGLDYGGLGALKALGKTAKYLANGRVGTKEYVRGISRDLFRAGLGLTGAVMITNQLKDEDFIGAYDPSRAQIASLENSNTNSVRIRNKWISIDWFGPLGVPMSAIMYARKYGDTAPEKAFQYVKGAGTVIQNLPGIDTLSDLIGNTYKKGQTLEEMGAEALKYSVDNLSARMLPSIISDTAKATDKFEREAGKDPFKKLQSKIPFLRQSLPEKKNIFGEQIKTEPAWSTILFGSRVKTDKETPLLKELKDISEATGKSINFTDWNRTTSVKIAQFKSKMPDVYDEAIIYYGQELKKELDKLMASSKYNNADDVEKLKMINNIDSDAIDNTFKHYRFKYKKSPLVPSK